MKTSICIKCKRPLAHTKLPPEGFVRHGGLGFCRKCYDERQHPTRKTSQEDFVAEYYAAQTVGITFQELADSLGIKLASAKVALTRARRAGLLDDEDG